MNFCVTSHQSRNSILQRFLGFAVILLGIAGSHELCAQSTNFNYTGTVITYTITTPGNYQFTAGGAQGGNNGGYGALLSGTYTLTSGDILEIAVGGAGAYTVWSGGGGGGTFIYTSTGTPLLIAAGGGGSGVSVAGGVGRTNSAAQGGTPSGGSAGTGGNGGGAGSYTGSHYGGAGGAGFYSAGTNASGGAVGGTNGPTFAGGSSSYGGTGGFGGGGGAGNYGGGGGGGYNGGGGGRAAGSAGGGGGGSYVDAGFSYVTGVSGGNTNANGFFTLTFLMDLFVGSNSSSQTTNFTSGTNSYSSTYVGYDAGASNNLLTIGDSGTLLSNSSIVSIGYNGSSNSMVISNGGSVADFNGYIGYDTGSSNNSVLLTDTSSLWSNSSTLYVGYGGSSNSMVISNGATVADNSGYIGNNSNASYNIALVTGSNSLWTNQNNIYVGEYGSNNSLVISNGAKVVDGRGYIGDYSSGNTVTVTGSNSLWSNSSALYFAYHRGTNFGTNNSLVISDGATVSVGNGAATIGSRSSAVGILANNRILVTGTNSTFNSSGGVFLGSYEDGDTITVSDGAKFYGKNDYIGYGNGLGGGGGNSNTFTVTGFGSLYSNVSSLYMGYGAGNLFLVSNAASAFVDGYLNVGYGGGSSSGSNNVIVTGATSSLVANSVYLGYGESQDKLIVSGGASVSAQTTYLGYYYSYAGSSNSLLVTDIGSVFTNSGSLYVGYDGVSNSLTVANGGTVYASDITIAYNTGSTATLNIGSLGGTDGAGTITTPTIAFGSGTGTINFNQTNTASLTSSISGLGTVQQLGSGTTILSGDNTYTGVTTISRGTLQAASTNALGGSDVTLGGGGSTATLSLATNLTISSLIWSSNSVMSFTPGSQTLAISGAFTNAGGGVFDFGGYSTAGTNTLITFGTNAGGSFTTNSFSVAGGSIWGFILDSSSLSAYYISGGGGGLSDLYVGSNSSSQTTNFTTGTNSYSNTYVGYDAGSSNNALIVSGSTTLLTNSDTLYAGYDGSSNLMVISNGAFVASSNGIIGNNSDSSNNRVVVTGGSTWSNCIPQEGDLIIGSGGSGNSMLVDSNSAVYANTVYIGRDGSSNQITISGSSSLTVNGEMFLGNNGSGNSLIVSNGGSISGVTSFNIGNNQSSSNNYLLVTGATSAISIDSFYLGTYGAGNLVVVSNSGTIIAQSASICSSQYSSNNTLNIAEGGNVTINNDINVGSAGSGASLQITSGGQLFSASGIIAYQQQLGGYYGTFASTNNSALVSGSGSMWSNSGALTIGYGGSGTLTVANSGSVVASSITIASLGFSSNNPYSYSYASFGTLNIGSLGGSDTAGTITTPTIAFGSGTGTINFNQTDSTTLTSSISGLGTVQQLGIGTTILSGDNTYTGVTTISRGTLQAASTNALGSSTVTLGGSGSTATLALSTNLTISSLIWSSNSVMSFTPRSQTLSISGAFTNAGGGVFDFGGYSTPGTNTLITFGTNAGGSFTTNSFSVSDGSIWGFILDSSSLSAYYISGGGGGGGGNTTNTGSTNITSNTTNSTTTVESGVTTVTTGATLTSSNYVTVAGGALVNSGTITTPTLSVSNGAAYSMLEGTLNGSLNIATGGNFFMDPSVINGNVNNSGRFTVVGLNNIINGTLTLTSSSTLTMGTGSQLTVNGSATLGGTFVVANAMPFGTKFTFLTATGPIKGSFDSIIAPAGERGRLVIEGDPTASIIIAPQSYTQMAANQNQVNVATALNSFIPYTSGDQQVVSTSLDSLTASQYNQAFNAIMPTFYQQVATIAFNEANALNMELNQRLWGLRLAEGGGFSMSGLAENYPMIQEGQGDGGKGVLDAKKDILRPGLDNHWGLFVDGNGIFSQANSANMLPGYNSESGGITTGLTYKWNDKVASGIYAGYQGTYTKSGANGSGLGTGSSLTDNAVRFGVFGTYGNKDGKGLYLNALAGGAYHNYQATRVIQYTGIDRTANSQPGAGELDTMLATGYDIQKGKFTFGPTASLQYTYLGVNSLNETGAQSLNYNSSGWNSSSMLSSVGAHAAYNWIAHHGSGGDIVVVPQINLNWQHEFMQNPYDISGNLGGTSPTFSNWSAAPIRDFLYTGVGFTVDIGKRWNTSFFYNAAAGNQNLTSQNIFWSAGVKF